MCCVSLRHHSTGLSLSLMLLYGFSSLPPRCKQWPPWWHPGGLFCGSGTVHFWTIIMSVSISHSARNVQFENSSYKISVLKMKLLSLVSGEAEITPFPSSNAPFLLVCQVFVKKGGFTWKKWVTNVVHWEYSFENCLIVSAQYPACSETGMSTKGLFGRVVR